MPGVDLHSHSTISDGSLTPAQLIQYAASKGVSMVALTDHDDVAGLAEAAREALVQGLCFVNGVEVSVTWKGRTIHVVGLAIDPESAGLVDGLSRQRHSRVERAERMAADLARHGIQDALAGAYGFAGDGVIGRTHFARFLVSLGHSRDVRSVFRRFLVRGKPGYVPHKWAEMGAAVSWIRDAGGVAVLAHPGRYDFGRVTMETLMAEFRDVGGEALEAISGSHTREMNERYLRYARTLDFKVSCGSDYHGPIQGYGDMGRLPELPADVAPVWRDWPA